MKYLIASDIHGSWADLKVLLERYKEEKADKLILLGDIYYHGPRNNLPEGYDPKIVAKMLNEMKDQLIVIRGNCDAEVDEMISDFQFNSEALLVVGDKTVYFTHGHKYNMENPPKCKIDCLIYGHLHTGFIIKENIIYANAGSISLPKQCTPKSYLVFEENSLTLKDLNGNQIRKEIF